MDFLARISDIEAALAVKDISVDAFCAAAAVNRATWQRWKAGTHFPNGRLWARVESAAVDLALFDAGQGVDAEHEEKLGQDSPPVMGVSAV